MFLGKYLTVTLSAGSLAEIKNPAPGQAQFPQFSVIERLCVAGSNKGSDHGALK